MSDDLLSIFDEVEKGTVPSVRVKEFSHRCPMCMRREKERARENRDRVRVENVSWLIKSPVGDINHPPKTVAYLNDCPICGYTCVFPEDLVKLTKKDEKSDAS